MNIHPNELQRIRAMAEAHRAGRPPIMLSEFIAGLESTAELNPSALLALLDLMEEREKESAFLVEQIDRSRAEHIAAKINLRSSLAALRAELAETEDALLAWQESTDASVIAEALRQLRAADERIMELREENAVLSDIVIQQPRAAAEEFDRRDAQIARLRTALEPFARFAEALDSDDPGIHDGTIIVWHRRISILLSHLRAARDVLK